MLIIPVEGDNIERALKNFKKKVEKTKLVKQLRDRKYFNKPSEKKRSIKLKAIYVEGKRREEED
jgi:small subunit ribosomal protein S21